MPKALYEIGLPPPKCPKLKKLLWAGDLGKLGEGGGQKKRHYVVRFMVGSRNSGRKDATAL
jgi:hypothetical protein